MGRAPSISRPLALAAEQCQKSSRSRSPALCPGAALFTPRTCVLPLIHRKPGLLLASACNCDLTSQLDCLADDRGVPGRACDDLNVEGPSTLGGLVQHRGELGFEVDIDALLTDAADTAVLAAQTYVSALAMKAAVTLPSWSMSPSTMPRAAGCLMQRRKPWDGSVRACVWDPSLSRNVSECRSRVCV